MTDTPASVADLYRHLLLARSGAERLRMTCDMFDTARRMVLAGLPDGLAGEAERRAALFLRTYGGDFDPPTRDRIVARIRASAGEGSAG